MQREESKSKDDIQKMIESALQPMVLDHQFLTFDVAGFAEAFVERGHKARVGSS
jgi:hypothetical protein